MRETTRLIATFFVWFAFTITMVVMGVVLTSSNITLDQVGGAFVFGIMLIMALSAALSTRWIWGAESFDTSDRRAKAKRRTDRSRVERLIEALDDDEVYDLEALLLARDQDDARDSFEQ